MIYKKTIYICLGIFLFLSSSRGQQVDNIGYSQALDKSANKLKTLITYDLNAPYENIPFQINVKVTTIAKVIIGTAAGGGGKETTIKKSFYLKELTGDVGDIVYPGLKKKISWDHIEELVHFNGDIILNIEATPSVQVETKVKRGKKLSLTLVPYFATNKNYSLKLFRANKEVTPLEDILLNGSIQVLIPKKTKVKGKYQLAVRDGEKTYFSNTFKVRRKFSLGWITVPIIAVPAYIFLQQYIDDNKSLPGPPKIN